MKQKSTARLVTKSRVDEIKRLSVEVVKSKRKCNDIIKIFEIMEGCTENVALACIRANHKIFCHFLDNNELQMLPQEDVFAEKSEVKLRQWLRERYAQSIQLLSRFLIHESSTVRELALCTLMKYVEAEGKKPLKCNAKAESIFPVTLFEGVVESLLNADQDQDELIARFQEYLEYDDIRYNFMKHLLCMVKTQAGVDDPDSEHSVVEIRLNNLLASMLTLSLPDGEEKLSNLLIPVNSVSPSVSSVKVQREMYSKLWLTFVKIKLTSAIYKKILISLPDKVIPHLHDPLIVSDWLITCYDRGGAVSLMALNGLFILMTKHNLEYPDFYTKLYNIMGNEVFSTKYKARFFHLLDIFLQSLLLPTYTIAAFIKKLSRMALTAPPGGALLIIDLVINLLVRHDTCRTLIHRETTSDLTSDPYLPDEPDISKCRAIESSLWEIKTLQTHWHHRIVTQALRIEKPLPHTENVLDELLETNYEELMAKETKKSKKMKAKEAGGLTVVPLNHTSPTGLLNWESSDLQNLWVVEEG